MHVSSVLNKCCMLESHFYFLPQRKLNHTVQLNPAQDWQLQCWFAPGISTCSILNYRDVIFNRRRSGNDGAESWCVGWHDNTPSGSQRGAEQRVWQTGWREEVWEWGERRSEESRREGWGLGLEARLRSGERRKRWRWRRGRRGRRRCILGSASVSRGGRSRSGGGAALSWRDRLTREGEGQTRGEETHRPAHTHTHTHTHKQGPNHIRAHTHAHTEGWEVKRER